MFTPNMQASLRTMLSRNLDGEEVYAEAVPMALSIVNLLSASQKTSVRTDSSATHGQADEMASNGKILTQMPVNVDDLIAVAGGTFRVRGVHPRYTVFGIFDHYEVVLELVEE